MTASRGIRRRRLLVPDCHPERRHKAKGYCAECYARLPEVMAASRERMRQLTLANPELVAERRRNAMAKLYAKRIAIIDALKAHPCMDCGGSFLPCAMDFDHRDPTIKEFPISRWTRVGWASVMAEIEKCDLVCANCHRVRTWRRFRPEERAA